MACFKFSTSEQKSGKYILSPLADVHPSVSPRLLLLFTIVFPLKETDDPFPPHFPNDLPVETFAVIGINGFVVVLPVLNLSFGKYSICPSENISEICSPLPLLLVSDLRD